MKIVVIVCSVLAVVFLLALILFRFKGPKRQFSAIRDDWRKHLEQAAWVEEVKWTASEPVVFKDHGFLIMFKEASVRSIPTEVTVLGKIEKCYAEGTGYAVAMQDERGRWTPTQIFMLDKKSPEEALVEMHRIVRLNNQSAHSAGE